MSLVRMNSVFVIGPKEWCKDHEKWLETHNTTTMQYSPSKTFVKAAFKRINEIEKPFWLYVYVPKLYKFSTRGSGSIEYRCRVIDVVTSTQRIFSPWPTFELPRHYDKHADTKYEFWFKVDCVEQTDISYEEIPFIKKDSSIATYLTNSSFISAIRGKMLFAELGDVAQEAIKQDVLADEIENNGHQREGRQKEYFGKRYERSAINRLNAIKLHGLACNACGFNFEITYGTRGADYIEVHHVKPISTFAEEQHVDPKTDLITVCANCHRMMHRRPDNVLTVEQIKVIIQEMKLNV